jgi:hypothetical protein
VTDEALHPVQRLHLAELTGPLGIWQHASGTAPDRSHGYCTDDVARALGVDLLHGLELGWTAVRDDARRSLDFLRAAYNPALGLVRNFRSADGEWLDEAGSQDCQGRALLALGSAIAAAADPAFATDPAFAADAADLFMALLPGAGRQTSLRACASAILGCDAALDGPVGTADSGPVRRTLVALAGRLDGAFAASDPDDGWPWPEPILTYENALLPRAMVAAGLRLGLDGYTARGLRALDWLIGVQTRSGVFSPVGNRGWWPKNGRRARFDQQPIDAAATVLAAAAALEATGDPRYRVAAQAAYGWFLGDNAPGLMVVDVLTGGCRDGLSATAVNANQGAESTLAWQITLETLRRLRSPARSADRPAWGTAILPNASPGAATTAGADA